VVGRSSPRAGKCEAVFDKVLRDRAVKLNQTYSLLTSGRVRLHQGRKNREFAPVIVQLDFWMTFSEGATIAIGGSQKVQICLQ
jgi:hypothetical protein